MILAFQGSLFRSIFHRIFKLFPEPLPKAIFGGPKCRPSLKRLFWEPLLDFRGSQNPLRVGVSPPEGVSAWAAPRRNPPLRYTSPLWKPFLWFFFCSKNLTAQKRGGLWISPESKIGPKIFVFSTFVRINLLMAFLIDF